MPIDCERVRLGFPDLMEGPADADLVAHLSDCAGCARELRSFKAVVEAVLLHWEHAGHAEHAGHTGHSGQGGNDVPDPGEAYWEQFLPTVRARIARDLTARVAGRGAWTSLLAHPSRAVATAAAVALMVAAGLTALMLSGPVPPDAGSIEVAGLRLQMALDRAAALPADPADGIVLPGAELPEVSSPRSLTEALPEIDPADLIMALDELYRAPGAGYLCVEDDIAGLLQGLTADQAARLRAQLSAEQC